MNEPSISSNSYQTRKRFPPILMHPNFRQRGAISSDATFDLGANSDFAAGFITSENFFVNFRGNDIFELTLLDGNGNYPEGIDGAKLAASPYVSEQRGSLGVFSLVPPVLGLGFDFDPTFRPNRATPSEPKSETPVSVQYLYHITGQAGALREKNRQEREQNNPKEDAPVGPKIMHFPVVILA